MPISCCCKNARPKCVTLLADWERSDILLLRLALAGRAAERSARGGLGRPVARALRGGRAARRPACTNRKRRASSWTSKASRTGRWHWPRATTRRRKSRATPKSCMRAALAAEPAQGGPARAGLAAHQPVRGPGAGAAGRRAGRQRGDAMKALDRLRCWLLLLHCRRPGPTSPATATSRCAARRAATTSPCAGTSPCATSTTCWSWTATATAR